MRRKDLIKRRNASVKADHNSGDPWRLTYAELRKRVSARKLYRVGMSKNDLLQVLHDENELLQVLHDETD